jgi:hypothetical protein
MNECALARDMYFSERIASFRGEFPLAPGQRSPTNASRNKSISRFRGNSLQRQRRQRENLGTENKIDFPHVYFAPAQQKLLFPHQFSRHAWFSESKITLCDANLLYSEKNVMKCDVERTFPFDFCLFLITITTQLCD